MRVHLSSLRLLPDQYPVLDAYPFCLPILQRDEPLDLMNPVTFFVGENGTGKSTLLSAIARKCGIHIWETDHRARVGHNPHEEKLHRFLSVSWTDGPVPGSFFASEIFRGFSKLLDEWASSDPGLLKYFGGESLMTKSHGQSHMAFFRSRFRLKGLYLLDEPENALSPTRLIELRDIIRDAGRQGAAQFVIATHSPILMACPSARIYSFDGETIRVTRYKDTMHYRVYRQFFSDNG